MPHPINVWQNHTTSDADLRWLLDNQPEIVKAWPARSMPRTRPLKVWHDGRVRIEWCGTFPSAKAAREEAERRMQKAKFVGGE
jgi:hypothetical protein